MNENEGYYPLDFPIMQTGKFTGEFPIEIKIIGKKQMEIIDTTFIINEGELNEGSKKIITSWYGKTINGLLDYSYDPLTISSIIDMSIEQKILTPYTGFILIDETLIDNSNDSDDSDGDRDNGGGDDDLTDIEDNITGLFSLDLSAYPNPFNSTVTLKVTIPEVGDYKLIIYNILGQKIKEFDLSELSNGIHYLKWNGESEYNSRVASGLYIGVLHGKNITKTVKLQLVE
jgi:hypothetical protein